MEKRVNKKKIARINRSLLKTAKRALNQVKKTQQMKIVRLNNLTIKMQLVISVCKDHQSKQRTSRWRK